MIEAVLSLWQSKISAEEASQALYDNTQRTMQLAKLTSMQFIDQLGEANLRIVAQYDEYSTYIATNEADENIYNIKAFGDWIKSEADHEIKEVAAAKTRKTDLSLAYSMLNDWILQRAATGREAISSTDQTAWANASKLINLSPQLVGRPDLFLHQARFELAALGLDNSWINKELEFVSNIKQDAKWDDDIAMNKTYDLYDSSILITLTKTTKPDVLINLINDEGVDMGEDAKTDIRNNKFELTLIGDLAEDTTYKTVYFDEYEWSIVYLDKAKDSWDSNDDFNSDPGQALTEG